MTVHAAKGLEFDVVVLADQGRERAARGLPDVLVVVGRPGGDARARRERACSGPRSATPRPRRRSGRREREEGRRLQYVAMTRARQHLIVSGAFLARRADVDRRGVPAARDRARRRRRRRPRRGPPHRAGDASGGARGRRERRAQGRCGSGRPRPRGGGAARALHATAAAWRRRSRRSPRSRRRRPCRCGASPTAHSRSTAGAATGTSPSGCWGCPSRSSRRRRSEGLGPLEVGDAVHLELERPDGRWRDLYPTCDRRPIASGSRRSWPRGRTAPLRRAGRGARPRPAGGAVRVRGRRRALPRPVRRLRHGRPTARRWSSTSRRTGSTSASPRT